MCTISSLTRYKTQFVLGIVLFGLVVGIGNQTSTSGHIQEPLAIPSSDDPIYLANNSEVLRLAALRGWTGEGSTSDPIIVKDLKITQSWEYNTTSLVYGVLAYRVAIAIENVSLAIKFSNLTIDVSSELESGIILLNSSNISLEGSNVVGGRNAILGVGCSNISLSNNSFSSKYRLSTSGHSLMGIGAVQFMGSDNLSQDNNNITNSDAVGVFVYAVSNVTIRNNNVLNNRWSGIVAEFSSNISLLDNVIINNSYGGVSGLYFDEVNTIALKGNFISNHTSSLRLVFAIDLKKVTDVLFTENTIANNPNYAISIDQSGKMWFYHNNFINNKPSGPAQVQVVDSYSTDIHWYNETLAEGNYWDGYFGEDLDGDGFGETPYQIRSAYLPDDFKQDLYPKMEPYAEFFPSFFTCDHCYPSDPSTELTTSTGSEKTNISSSDGISDEKTSSANGFAIPVLLLVTAIAGLRRRLVTKKNKFD